MRRWTNWGRLAATLLIAFASSVYAANLPSSKVPFVGCPADGQAGPLAPPKGEAISVTIAPAIARRLAYYQAGQGHGVLGPKGWHCREWYGSSGGFLAVTPQEIRPPYFPPPTISGPAIYIGSADAGTSGRFEVAITAARLFPQSTREFVERIKGEDILPAKEFDVKPFPSDRLRYLSNHVVEFTTPANKDGLGTSGMLRASRLPIRGLVALNPEAEIDSLTEIYVRLPAELSDLTQPILAWESTCLIHKQGRVK